MSDVRQSSHSRVRDCSKKAFSIPARALNTVQLFTPTIIQELGFTAAQAQLLTIPPFACGCVATIAVGLYSDKYNLRGPFIIGSCLIALVG
jgi:Sec-independent protein secretion pathway component TatC